MVTPALFAAYPDARSLAAARHPASCGRRSGRWGFFRDKAKALKGDGRGGGRAARGQVPAPAGRARGAPGRGAEDRRRGDGPPRRGAGVPGGHPREAAVAPARLHPRARTRTASRRTSRRWSRGSSGARATSCWSGTGGGCASRASRPASGAWWRALPEGGAPLKAPGGVQRRLVPGGPLHVLGLPGDVVGLELLHAPADELALQAGQVVDEDRALEVVGLVLQGDGEQLVGLDLELLARVVERADPDLGRAVDVLGLARDGEAALGVGRLPLGPDDDRIDEVEELLPLLPGRGVDDDAALQHADLGRGRGRRRRRRTWSRTCRRGDDGCRRRRGRRGAPSASGWDRAR